MKRSANRILTTHVGNLPAPDDLVETMLAHPQGRPTEPSFGSRLRTAVADIGIDILDDGDLGKTSWNSYLRGRPGGYERRPLLPGERRLGRGGAERQIFDQFHLEWSAYQRPIAPRGPPLMWQIHAGGYAIEAANPRHAHAWDVWKQVKLPEGKMLYPGFISQKTNVGEHPELVAWRIKLYASVVGRGNVVASTDCGQGFPRAATDRLGETAATGGGRAAANQRSLASLVHASMRT